MPKKKTSEVEASKPKDPPPNQNQKDEESEKEQEEEVEKEQTPEKAQPLEDKVEAMQMQISDILKLLQKSSKKKTKPKPRDPSPPGSSDEESEDEDDDALMNSTMLGETSSGKRNKPVGKIKVYKGERSGSTLEQWIFSTNQYFEANQVPQRDRVPMATLHLEGSALLWWRERCNAADKDIEEPILTWSMLQSRMKKYFQPPDSVRLLKFKLKELKQTGYLHSYINAFLELNLQIPDMDPQERLDNFIFGLNARIRSEVEYKAPANLEAAITIAERFDTTILKAERIQTKNRASERDSGRNNNYRKDQKTDINDKNDKKATLAATLTKKPDNKKGKNDSKPTGYCYHCGKKGEHFAKQCPDRPNNNFKGETPASKQEN